MPRPLPATRRPWGRRGRSMSAVHLPRAIRETLAGASVSLGAQNCHYEPKGAFTGEVSPVMLADLGCRYVILGHSERALTWETDALVNRKVRAALATASPPLSASAKTWPSRMLARPRSWPARCRRPWSTSRGDDVAGMVIAYEPLWAIGTGRPASAEQAGATIGVIRRIVAGVAGEGPAGAVRLQYGGASRRIMPLSCSVSRRSTAPWWVAPPSRSPTSSPSARRPIWVPAEPRPP